MIFTKRMMLIFVLFVGFIQVGDSQELGEIYDAVFSHDGTKIGVGTETGFYVYDRISLECMFSLLTPNGVHFIRWSPNGDKVFLSLWHVLEQEGSYPSEWKLENTYWVYDINKHLLLFEFQDEMRWFYFFGYGSPPSYAFYKASINFPDKRCAHPNSVRFSPDGNRLVWISMENQVKELDLSTNQIRVIIPHFQEEDYIVSFGFLDNPEMLWMGTLFEEILETYPYKQSSSRIIFFKNVNNEYQQIRVEPFHSVALEASSFRDWWLVLNPYPFIDTATIYFSILMSHSLFSLSSKEKISITRGGGESGDTLGEYRMRTVFVDNGKRVKIIFFAVSKYSDYHLFQGQSREFDVENLSVTNTSGWISIPNFGMYLLQPFSPDGGEFLHIRDGKLYIYTTDTFEGEVVLPKPAGVSGAEWLK
jgi:WD40 repeat protein